MKRHYCNEDARNLILLEIKNRKAALELYPKIIEVVQKFDGKVLNKRFDTALKKADSRLGYDRGMYQFRINMSCFDNRCCKSVKVDSNGYSSTNYINDYYVRLNGYLQPYSHNTNELSALTEERLIAENVIVSLNEGKEKLEAEITRLEASLDKIAEWKEKLEALTKEVQGVMSEVPYLVRDYCDLNYRVENN